MRHDGKRSSPSFSTCAFPIGRLENRAWPAGASALWRHACSATWPLPAGMLLWWSCLCSTFVGPFFPQSIFPPWPCSTMSSVSRGAAPCPSGKSMRPNAVKCLCYFATSSRFCCNSVASPLQANDKWLITTSNDSPGETEKISSCSYCSRGQIGFETELSKLYLPLEK